MSVFSVVAFIYGKTALGWLAVWFCILFSVLLVLRQVHGRGKKGPDDWEGPLPRRSSILTAVVTAGVSLIVLLSRSMANLVLF